jgi:hypothetical protein
VREKESEIFPAGFMGAGKSESGRVAARCAGKKFVDLEEKIQELEVMSVTEISAQKGEPYLRGAEYGCRRPSAGTTGRASEEAAGKVLGLEAAGTEGRWRLQ